MQWTGSHIDSESLHDRLADQLPGNYQFTFHHVSTPPTKCDPLFAPPPGRKPERTFCESHFLTASVKPTTAENSVFIFAVELLVYTTRRLTTIFVSKADSTGLLSSLELPQTTQASPIRTIASTFIQWLAENRQRPNARLVVSLFARAQNQYLFPGSVENSGKHVLDDRQLIRWWCRTLDPVLRTSIQSTRQARSEPTEQSDTDAQAYVVVPGFDKNETTGFFPPSWRTDPQDSKKWKHGHPLYDLAVTMNAPPRCLVPRFPDDPKSRYLDELDEEIPDASLSQTLASPSKRGSGQWKTIKTLEQFWETMAFRQECSSGRMVGFIWVVFTPADVDISQQEEESQTASRGATPSPTASFTELPSISEVLSGPDRSLDKRKRRSKLTGPIVPRKPKIKTSSSNLSVTSQGEESPFWKWPESSRGQVVLDQGAYTRVHDLLLRLDFEKAAAAANSTTKWIHEVAVTAGSPKDWGETVVGRRAAIVQQVAAKSNASNVT